jgi:integrase
MAKREDGDGTVWFDREKKKWRARFHRPGMDKPKTKSCRTKTEALAWIRSLKAEAPPTQYDVKRAYDEWMLLHVEPLCRKSTRDQYQYLMVKHILPEIGTMAVEDVLPKHIQTAIAGMAAKGLSSKTMSSARIAAHGLFEWMVTSEILERNPCRKIRVPVTESKPRRPLAPAEVPLLLEAMKHSRWQNSVRFLLLTGLRRGELLALKWSDIEDGWLVIRRTLATDGTEGPPKSKAGNRSIRIGNAVQAILDAQRDMLHIERIVSPYVFPAETGATISPGTYYHTLKRFGAVAGVSLSVHELRHSFVSYLGAGMDLKTLQSILGHASSTQTLDLYQHILDGAMERATEAIDAAADGIFAGPKTRIVSVISPVISLDEKTGSR